MKQKTVIIVSIVWLSICSVSNLHGQWIQTSGPYGGDIKAFAANGTNLRGSHR